MKEYQEYRVIDTHPTKPEIVDGVYYEHELQKVPNENDVFVVDNSVKNKDQ